MWTRRQFVSRGSLGALLGTTGAALALRDAGDAGDKPEGLPDGSASRGMVTPEAETAIRRGLSFLDSQRRGGAFGTRNYHGHVAVCSLSAMAFMSAGYQPGRGKYGKLLTETLRFVLRYERGDHRHDGYLYNPAASPQGPMYGHGFGTLFLGEVYGMVHEPQLRKELRDKLRKAVDLIVRSQNPAGGWRYHPYSRDADLSVTVCQIMALRSGRNAGFAVPKEVVERCIDYVKKCQNHDGSFNYQAHSGHPGPRHPFARTAAGLSALYSAGIYEGDAIDAGLRYLAGCKPSGAGFGRPDMQYFYGHYYAVQAMWTAGGQFWQDWFPAIREELLARQNQNDGSWDDQIDPHYATAVACIILQVPNNYLPILQK